MGTGGLCCHLYGFVKCIKKLFFLKETMKLSLAVLFFGLLLMAIVYARVKQAQRVSSGESTDAATLYCRAGFEGAQTQTPGR